MEIIVSGKDCVITPLSPVLNKRECEKLLETVKEYAFFNIGINMSFVEDCTNDFIEYIAEKKNISIFNIPSDIFAIFNMMKIDKTINLFTSEIDFKTNKNRLTKPNLKLVQV